MVLHLLVSSAGCICYNDAMKKTFSVFIILFLLCASFRLVAEVVRDADHALIKKNVLSPGAAEIKKVKSNVGKRNLYKNDLADFGLSKNYIGRVPFQRVLSFEDYLLFTHQDPLRLLRSPPPAY